MPNRYSFEPNPLQGRGYGSGRHYRVSNQRQARRVPEAFGTGHGLDPTAGTQGFSVSSFNLGGFQSELRQRRLTELENKQANSQAEAVSAAGASNPKSLQEVHKLLYSHLRDGDAKFNESYSYLIGTKFGSNLFNDYKAEADKLPPEQRDAFMQEFWDANYGSGSGDLYTNAAAIETWEQSVRAYQADNVDDILDSQRNQVMQDYGLAMSSKLESGGLGMGDIKNFANSLRPFFPEFSDGQLYGQVLSTMVSLARGNNKYSKDVLRLLEEPDSGGKSFRERFPEQYKAFALEMYNANNNFNSQESYQQAKAIETSIDTLSNQMENGIASPQNLQDVVDILKVLNDVDATAGIPISMLDGLIDKATKVYTDMTKNMSLTEQFQIYTETGRIPQDEDFPDHARKLIHSLAENGDSQRLAMYFSQATKDGWGMSNDIVGDIGAILTGADAEKRGVMAAAMVSSGSNLLHMQKFFLDNPEADLVLGLIDGGHDVSKINLNSLAETHKAILLENPQLTPVSQIKGDEDTIEDLIEERNKIINSVKDKLSKQSFFGRVARGRVSVSEQTANLIIRKVGLQLAFLREQGGGGMGEAIKAVANRLEADAIVVDGSLKLLSGAVRDAKTGAEWTKSAPNNPSDNVVLRGERALKNALSNFPGAEVNNIAFVNHPDGSSVMVAVSNKGFVGVRVGDTYNVDGKSLLITDDPEEVMKQFTRLGFDTRITLVEDRGLFGDLRGYLIGARAQYAEPIPTEESILEGIEKREGEFDRYLQSPSPTSHPLMRRQEAINTEMKERMDAESLTGVLAAGGELHPTAVNNRPTNPRAVISGAIRYGRGSPKAFVQTRNKAREQIYTSGGISVLFRNDIYAHEVKEELGLEDSGWQAIADGEFALTAEQNKDLLDSIVEEVVLPQVNKNLGDKLYVSLSPNQRAALASFSFLSRGRLNDEVVSAIESGDKKQIIDAFLDTKDFPSFAEEVKARADLALFYNNDRDLGEILFSRTNYSKEALYEWAGYTEPEAHTAPHIDRPHTTKEELLLDIIERHRKKVGEGNKPNLEDLKVGEGKNPNLEDLKVDEGNKPNWEAYTPNLEDLKRWEGNVVDRLFVPPDDSGATLAQVDLAHLTDRELNEIAKIDSQLAEEIRPFVGKYQEEAKKAIKEFPFKPTAEKAKIIGEVKLKSVVNHLDSLYKKYKGDKADILKDVNPCMMREAVSVAWQLGSNLPYAARKFWKTILDNDPEAMINELENFGEEHGYMTRRRGEARRLKQCLARQNAKR